MRQIGVWSLILLAFGGYVGGIPVILAVLPMNPILLGAIGTLAAIIITIASRKADLSRLWPILLLWIFFAGSAVWLPIGIDYGQEKLAGLATLTLLSVVGGALLISDHDGLKAWNRSLIIFGAIIGVFQLVSPSESSMDVGRLVAEGSNTIAAGRAAGAAALVLLVLALAHKGIKKAVFLIATLPFIGFILATATRGAAIAVLIGWLAVLFTARRSKVSIFPLVVLVSSYAVWVYVASLGFFTERLTLLGKDSSEARLILYRLTLDSILSAPIGLGWGRIRDVYDLSGELPAGIYEYPHNIVLEITSEAGWFAGICFVVLVVIALQRVLVMRDEVEFQVLFGLVVFFLINALVSGDVNSNRGLWVVVGAAVGAGCVFAEKARTAADS